MREILNIQVGQCGNHIGNKFWEHISVEHGINPNTGLYEGISDLQLQRINVYFNHNCRSKFRARSINVDLDSSTKDYTLNSPIASLFKPDNFLTGTNGSASNNYAKGYYTDGYEKMPDVWELVRLEVEKCDLLQGFQLLHGLGGGTGTGMTARILENLRNEWPDRIISTVTIIPSPKISETVVEPYNCILGFSRLISMCDETFCFDNEALYRICARYINFETKQPTYDDLNKLTSLTISGITTCLRFPGQLNSDLRKLSVNTVPFPRLHFFITGFGPLDKVFHYGQNKLGGGGGETENSNDYCAQKPSPIDTMMNMQRNTYISDLVMELFKPDNFMCSCNPQYGKYLTVATFFRGLLSTKEIEESMLNLQEKKSSLFVDWIPSNTQTAVCDIPPNGMNYSSTFIANSTSIRETLIRILDHFDVMLKKRAFLHWYLNEGMEEDEFNSAERHVRDLIEEYAQYEDGYKDDSPIPNSPIVHQNGEHSTKPSTTNNSQQASHNMGAHNFPRPIDTRQPRKSSSISGISIESSMDHTRF